MALSDDFENRVDLIAGIRGMEAAAFTRTIEIPFQDTLLRVIGREDFIAMKVFAGGPLDIEDARRAIVTAGDVLNMPLVRGASPKTMDRTPSRLSTNFSRKFRGRPGELRIFQWQVSSA